MENVKIKKVDVNNLKAVSSFTAFFDGKSAHVTGANGIGKSTVIRTLTDRLRGLKPSIVTKIGEKEGKTVMELTDGCRFEWSYNDVGKDELNYFTPASLKPVRREFFKHICGQYFPNQFDINKFLTTTEPRKRLQMISELVNVDLTEIQARYKYAFDSRRDAKRDLKILESQIKPKPEFTAIESKEILDIEQNNVAEIEAKIKSKKEQIETERNSLNAKYLINKVANEKLENQHKEAYRIALDKWIENEDLIQDEIEKFNDEQKDKSNFIIENQNHLDFMVKSYQDIGIGKFIDFVGIGKYIDELPKPEILNVYIQSSKPELTTLELPDPMPKSENLNAMKAELTELETSYQGAFNELEQKKTSLSELNSAKQVYEIQLKQWNDFKRQIDENQKEVDELEENVLYIFNEIKTMISKTKLPSEFSIDLTDKNDILFRPNVESDFLPITNETLASSAIFIAAFKLQANYLESFRVAHFDVSYLDFENRQKVLKEAIAMDIQLITESPAMDENSLELQYKITEI
jgi:energy-coupling factor transporter ATP-binding protein EcfA2